MTKINRFVISVLMLFAIYIFYFFVCIHFKEVRIPFSEPSDKKYCVFSANRSLHGALRVLYSPMTYLFEEKHHFLTSDEFDDFIAASRKYQDVNSNGN